MAFFTHHSQQSSYLYVLVFLVKFCCCCVIVPTVFEELPISCNVCIYYHFLRWWNEGLCHFHTSSSWSSSYTVSFTGSRTQSPPPRQSFPVFYDYAVRQIVRLLCIGECQGLTSVLTFLWTQWISICWTILEWIQQLACVTVCLFVYNADYMCIYAGQPSSLNLHNTRSCTSVLSL